MYLRGDGELVWDEADDFSQALQTLVLEKNDLKFENFLQKNESHFDL